MPPLVEREKLGIYLFWAVSCVDAQKENPLFYSLHVCMQVKSIHGSILDFERGMWSSDESQLHVFLCEYETSFFSLPVAAF